MWLQCQLSKRPRCIQMQLQSWIQDRFRLPAKIHTGYESWRMIHRKDRSKTRKSGDGYSCNDVNECESSPCDINASCSNTEGSFSCQCNSGYQGSGFMCTDVNECATRLGQFSELYSFPGHDRVLISYSWQKNDPKISPCDDNATCVNEDGDFSCECNVGFNGDGFSCTDVNECDYSPCDANATCTNEFGSFSCSCNAGFSGMKRQTRTYTGEWRFPYITWYMDASMDDDMNYNIRDINDPAMAPNDLF